MNIHRNYQRNLTRVFSVCSQTRSDSKYRFRIAVEKFSTLALSILFRSLTHGYGFQNTRCPAVGNSRPIYTKSRNTSFTLCKNTRKLFRTLKRFQTLLCLLWAETRGNRRAWAKSEIKTKIFIIPFRVCRNNSLFRMPKP